MRIPEYIRTDEFVDVLSTIEFMTWLVQQLEEHPLYWKWFIKAAHNALQGALVCALKGSANIGIYPKKLQAEWLNYYEISRTNPDVTPPVEKLAPFKELLSRACQPECMRYLGGSPLVLSKQEIEDLYCLNDEVRNNFVHFTPKIWSIEGVGLPRIVGVAIKITESLMLEHPACQLHLSKKKTNKFRRHIEHLRATLEVRG